MKSENCKNTNTTLVDRNPVTAQNDKNLFPIASDKKFEIL